MRPANRQFSGAVDAGNAAALHCRVGRLFNGNAPVPIVAPENKTLNKQAALACVRNDLHEILSSIAQPKASLVDRIENFEHMVFHRLHMLEARFPDTSEKIKPALLATFSPSSQRPSWGDNGKLADVLTPSTSRDMATISPTHSSPLDGFERGKAHALADDELKLKLQEQAQQIEELRQERDYYFGKLRASPMALSLDGRAVVVVISKTSPDESLGMDVRHIDGQLCIESVFADGAVARANKLSLNANPLGDVLEPGDIIYRVNDVQAGDNEDCDAKLVAECQCKMELVIHAVRC
jgi:hypothetical protein